MSPELQKIYNAVLQEMQRETVETTEVFLTKLLKKMAHVPNIIEFILCTAAQTGRIDVMEHLKNIPEAINTFSNVRHMHTLMIFACNNDHGKFVKYMLQDEYYKQYTEVVPVNILLQSSCRNGTQYLINFCLSNDTLTAEDIKGAAEQAASSGNMIALHILLQYGADINLDDVLIHAYMNNRIEMVKFLLTSSELLIPNMYGKIPGHANIHASSDFIFTNEYYRNGNLLPYLILEYGIDRTEEINASLEIPYPHTPQVLNLFAKRQLWEVLQKNTAVKDDTHPKIKI